MQKRKPAYSPRIRLRRILELLLMAVPKTGVFRRKRGNRQTIPRIRLRRILEFWHMAFAQDRAVQVPKRLSLEV